MIDLELEYDTLMNSRIAIIWHNILKVVVESETITIITYISSAIHVEQYINCYGEIVSMVVLINGRSYGPYLYFGRITIFMNMRIISKLEWDEYNYTEISGRELVEVRKYHKEILDIAANYL
jgi:hypothetical protein